MGLGNSKTTIELNGKQYDARTGKIISEPNSVPKIQPQKPSNHQVVDGFVRKQTHVTHATSVSPKKAASESIAQINHTKRPVSKSKALMRPAVKKPAQVKNDIQKVKYVTKPSHISIARQTRADSSPKSPMVSKFGRVGVGSSVKKSTAHLPIVSAPSHTASVNNVNRALNNELEKFEQALKNANSHIHQLEKDVVRKVPFLKRVGFKNRFANLTAISAAFLLLVGFFAYQNSAMLSMQFASRQAGINAKMPGYVPAGYGTDRTASASDGKVSLYFRSNTDTKGFMLTQQASNWNSSSLLANHVQKNTCQTCYQTWQEDGKIVYIYDNSNATWVDGGVWYQIEGNATLTSDQLLRLAKSL